MPTLEIFFFRLRARTRVQKDASPRFLGEVLVLAKQLNRQSIGTHPATRSASFWLSALVKNSESEWIR